MILGKLGLSEFANSFGNQPSGFCNLTGQVLNGLDADAEPERLVVGHRRGAAPRRCRCSTIGTETSGSIISPSQRAAASSACGRRSGSSPATASRPISASQDTAGPMERTVANAALNLQSIAGPDPTATPDYTAIFGPEHRRGRCRPRPARCPNYLSALDLELRARQAHRLQRHAHRRHAAEDRLRRARRGRRDHGPAAARSTVGTLPALPARLRAAQERSTSTTSGSAPTRRSSRSSRRSPTTRPTRTRR